MTVTTTAMPSTVATPEISISHRTRATIFACSGSSGLSSSGSALRSGELMAVRQQAREQVVVASADAGERLDRLLAARTALSRARLKALILDGAVAVGPRTIRDPDYRVNAGQT